MKDKAIIAAATVFAGLCAYAELVVPDRHSPIATMGRDCWRVLKKRCADNPVLDEGLALGDVAFCYVGSAAPPPPATGLAVWPHIKDYFKQGEQDAEIVTSNPDPEKPFFLQKDSERNCSTWGSPVNVTLDEYREWRDSHQNLMADGNCDEWCNGLNNAYARAQGKRGMYIANLPDSEERMAALRKFLGERPKTRYEQLELLKRFYEMRKERNFGGNMSILDAHLNSLHLAADFGASLVRMETTSSGQYRYQPSAMFTRGAARQFNIPWEWYIAGYVNGYSTNGWFLGDSVCRYPSSAEDSMKYPCYGSERSSAAYPGGSIRISCSGPEFGISRSLFLRTHFLAYLSGANFIQLEDWMILKMWNREKGGMELSPHGKIYSDFAKFMRKHTDRGSHYSPVAVCVPLAQGYPTWGGSPWDNQKFGYTEGDEAVDAVFYTLVPGYDYDARLAKGDEMCLRNTPYANMYDVIAPDAKSQTTEQILEVMRSYKALVVAGDYHDHEWEKSLKQFEAEGGKVVRVDAELLKDAVKSGKGRGISFGETRYPKLEATFAALQDQFFPFSVEGRCMYGLTVAGNHLWLYVFNNDGVTKFADAPQVLDETKTSEVRVSPRTFAPQFGKVTELISGKEVVTDGTTPFTWCISPGDFAIFEFGIKKKGTKE